VIEYYINELLTEGIYHIPMWTELTCVSASVEGEAASSSVCDVATANAMSLSVVANSSGLLRAASSSSTMQLGASAGNIAIDSDGTLLIFDIDSEKGVQTYVVHVWPTYCSLILLKNNCHKIIGMNIRS